MIFVDTSFLYPLFSANDPDHSRVAGVLARYRGRAARELFAMSNHVVAETTTLIRMTPPRSHAAAVRAAESLYAETLGRVHWASVEEERAAFAYFKQHQDKEYSFIDCLSFVLMDKLGIPEALAVDSDFTHRFTAHPGPPRDSPGCPRPRYRVLSGLSRPRVFPRPLRIRPSPIRRPAAD